MAVESDLERKCRLHAEKAGYRLIKIRTPGTRGFPDRLLIMPDRVIFIEFKHPGGTGRLSKLQQQWLGYLDAMGVAAHVCTSYKDFTAICRGAR